MFLKYAVCSGKSVWLECGIQMMGVFVPGHNAIREIFAPYNPIQGSYSCWSLETSMDLEGYNCT